MHLLTVTCVNWVGYCLSLLTVLVSLLPTCISVRLLTVIKLLINVCDYLSVILLETSIRDTLNTTRMMSTEFC